MKSALAFLLAAASFTAHAAWVEVARNDELIVMQDPASDRAEGSVVHTRELRDYPKPRAFFTMSIGSELVERHYDCTAKKWRRTRVDLFETRMAEGKPFDWNVNADAPWLPVAGEPLAEEGLKAACLRAAPGALK